MVPHEITKREVGGTSFGKFLYVGRGGESKGGGEGGER